MDNVILKELWNLQDKEYRDFQKKLVPDTKLEIIGVRVPLLRKLAKNIKKEEYVVDFFNSLPHKYYDECMLHSILISLMDDYDEVVHNMDKFLPYIDNWAVCDILSPKIFKKNTDKLYEKINIWLSSKDAYTIRFAVVTMINFYLDENFENKHIKLIENIKSDNYYVNMSRAWYFSYALIKQYDDTIKLIEEKKLDKFTHNKSIQKAIESYRLSDERKKYLKTLKK